MQIIRATQHCGGSNLRSTDGSRCRRCPATTIERMRGSLLAVRGQHQARRLRIATQAPKAAKYHQEPEGECDGRNSRPLLIRPDLQGRRGFILGSLAPCLCPCCASAKQLPARNGWQDDFFAWSMQNTMGQYEELIAPVKRMLFDEVLGDADGSEALNVLEVGFGTAPNLKYYPSDKKYRITGIDPNLSMVSYAKENASQLGMENDVEFLTAAAESLPIKDASLDVAVGTLVMCSVKDVEKALQEIRRVLKPGGRYLFIEHTAADRGTFLRFQQNIFNPLQMALADGCHLNRETGDMISKAGFSVVDMRKFSIPELSIIGPHVWGVATK